MPAQHMLIANLAIKTENHLAYEKKSRVPNYDL